MYENRKDKNNNIHYSRYIASWIRAGGTLPDNIAGMSSNHLFIEWLHSMNVDKEDIGNIRELVNNGKMELEVSARKFIYEKSKNRRDS